ncbi:hypothetical protein ATANTOWER_031960 [Ataeniobius toweri]|uniref:Uncharacterized protein n=1 Tax=Ataeniobius toweri TaxID=208326 RepID=A0ABU7B3L2_9TELE|nr:hypothetical protein [Ataeniobius toweri]
MDPDKQQRHLHMWKFSNSQLSSQTAVVADDQRQVPVARFKLANLLASLVPAQIQGWVMGRHMSLSLACIWTTTAMLKLPVCVLECIEFVLVCYNQEKDATH